MSGPRPIAVVLVSGGMDSCVAAVEARAEGFAPAFLHANYGQRTEARELVCFHAIADRLGVPSRLRLVADMRVLAAIGGSSLTDPSIIVERSPLAAAPGSHSESLRTVHAPDGAAGERGEDETTRTKAPLSDAQASRGPLLGAGRSAVPSSYVPFRNAHFLAAAVSWGEVLGAEAVYIGAVEEDSSGYPDCRLAYYRAFEEVVLLGTRPETRIRIVTPLIHLDKAAIVRRGLQLGAPFELTWSCYAESEEACGECDSCALRLRGFARAGAADPIRYRRRS